MENEFWHNAWQEGRTGWKQRRTNTRLERHWPSLRLDADASTSSSVLVPMCGNSPDLLWLAQESTSVVVGCELSELAVIDFFDSNNLNAETRLLDTGHKTYQCNNICIVCGDYFSLSPTTFESAGLPLPTAAYDRAAQVAMPQSMRAAYAAKYAHLLPPAAQVLMITVHYDQKKMNGPPFSVSDDEIQALYSEQFDISALARSSGPDILGNLADRGLDTAAETVFVLTKKAPS